MDYIKSGLKVFVSYGIGLIIFVIFLFTVLSLAKDNFSFWLQVYSSVIFLLTASMVYGDMKKLAIKEKRPQYNLNPYPIKGLILGFVGFAPFILLEIIYPFINFGDELADRIKHLTLNTLFGPLYTFIKMGNESAAAYAIAAIIVPIIAMLGYMAGFYGFELSRYYRKTPKNTPQNQTKSSGQNQKK